MKLDPEALEAAARTYKKAFGEYLTDVVMGRRKSPTPEAANHATEHALAVVFANLQPSKEVRELVEELRAKAVPLSQRQAEFVEHMAVSPGDPEGQDAADAMFRAADALSRMDGEGWRTVPVEPTDLMLAAGATEVDRTNPYSEDVAGNIYAAMLATSPSIEDPTQGSPAGGML